MDLNSRRCGVDASNNRPDVPKRFPVQQPSSFGFRARNERSILAETLAGCNIPVMRWSHVFEFKRQFFGKRRLFLFSIVHLEQYSGVLPAVLPFLFVASTWWAFNGLQWGATGWVILRRFLPLGMTAFCLFWGLPGAAGTTSGEWRKLNVLDYGRPLPLHLMVTVGKVWDVLETAKIWV